jgi:exodeoxyribonuclease VII small subunit
MSGAPAPDGQPPRDGEQHGAEPPANGGGQSSGPGSETQSYEAATARVEEIIKRLDSGEASLDETLALLAEGKALIEQCSRQLAAVGGALEQLELDELVSRLERDASR